MKIPLYARKAATITICLFFMNFLFQDVFSQTYTITPSRAYDYVDGIGVNIHLRFNGTPYVNAFESIVYPKLKKLGIKHVRDGIPYKSFLLPGDTIVKHRLIKLHDSLGIKVSYALDSRKVVDSLNLRDSAEYLSVFQSSAKLLASIQYLEGFNEPDLTIYGWYPANWDTLAYKIQRGLWNKVQNTPALAGIKIAGASLVAYYSPTRIGRIASMTPFLSNYYDYANYHAYDAGNQNKKFFPGYTYDWNLAATGMDTMRHNKPWIITEAGYENALNWNHPSSPNYVPTSYHYHSELACGKYYSVMFMEFFKRGAKKVYTYEFIDQNTADQSQAEKNFGLIRTDGTEKPAFTAIQNTLGILNDGATSFTPTSLTFTLSGDVSGINNALYQKTNGHYYLALWQGINKGVCYDFLSFTDLPGDSQQVKIVLPFVSSEIKVYQPLISGSPIFTFTNKDTIVVNVPDHLLLVELAPAGDGLQGEVRKATNETLITRAHAPKSENNLHLTLTSSEKQSGVIVVYNAAGAVLGKHPVTLQKGNNNFNLAFEPPSGVYVAVFSSGKGPSVSKKFFK